MSDQIYWLWLMGLQGIGIKKKQCLLRVFKDPESIFKSQRRVLREVLKDKDIDKIEAGKDLKPAMATASFCKKEKVRFVPQCEAYYPEALKNIYLPPLGLFLKGNAELLKAPLSIAMVGSRKATIQGKVQAKHFAAGLASSGVTVVSGLAEGIDGACHTGALPFPGSTIAVMGTGIDRCYPASNRGLYLQIMEKGLIVTEFFPGEAAAPFHFPMRNRIISGISDGLLVVEAKEKSGAMITVDHALEQGKNVYAIPGDIQIRQKEGSNRLLKEGAKLVTAPEDILEDYVDRFMFEPKKNENSLSKPESKDKIKLDADQESCLRMVSEGYDTFNDLALVTGLDIRRVNRAVSMLELNEMVRIEQGKIVPGNL